MEQEIILIHCMGGLGNQMFQYAAGKALSVRLGLPLKMYFEDHYKHAKRIFALDEFNITVEQPSRTELKSFLPDKGIVRKLKQILGLNYKGRLFRENTMFELDQRFFKIHHGVYLSGFWQHMSYFESIEKQLRNDFTFSKPACGENLITLNDIKSRPVSCSIHIRRTDYINPTSEMYPLTLNYYEKAVSRLENEIKDEPYYFIFSDDPEWVTNNFAAVPKERMTIISHNDGTRAHEDLRLMSACNHQIIANSSFSWWGAWLNNDKNKRIIYPDKWTVKINAQHTGLFDKIGIIIAC